MKWSILVVLAACQSSKPAGKLELIDAPQTADVAPLIAQEVARADADHKHLLVYLGATWCEPCVKFHEAAKAGILDEAFGDIRMLVFDADRDNEALERAGYKYDLVPLFALPGPDGHATGKQIQGSVKGANYVKEITPRLRSLVDEPGPPRRGSAAEGQRGSIDEPGPPRRGSAAEGQRGSIDEPGPSRRGSAAEGQRGSIDEPGPPAQRGVVDG